MRDGSHTTRLTQGVQFIHENNAGGFFFGLGKQVSDAGRPDADKHLHKLGAADREKRHLSFSRHRLGQEGFSGPRRSDQQNTFGDFPPEPTEFFRRLEKLDDFLEFRLGFFDSGHIGEANLDILLHINLGFALPDRHETATEAPTLGHPPHENQPDAKE